MMMLKANKFTDRASLDAYAQTISLKKGSHSISGTTQELAKLGLSATTTVHGIHCIATDHKVGTAKQPDRINRGAVHKFGINITK